MQRDPAFALAATLAAYAAAVSTAHAQTGDSVIQGRVIAADTSTPITEAIVTVRSPALQGDQTVLTDSSGFYRVPNLPPGVYLVHIDKEAHSSFEQGRIQLRASTTLRVDGALVPENVKGEELYLVADAPTIDVGSSSVSTTISNEMTKRVPLSRPGGKGGAVRSFEGIAQAAPEAKADLYGTSVAGATSPENRYIIDGLVVNNTAYGIGSTPLSAEFVHEVNVVTGGYLPEYGRATGGILNVVTKTGSNELSGNAWWNVTPGFLEGSRKTIVREGITVNYEQPQVSLISDLGADVGGPLIRDKLWFYLGADLATANWDVKRNLYQATLDPMGMPLKDTSGKIITQLVPGSLLEHDAQSRSAQVLGKLTFSPTRTHALTFTTVAAPYRSGNKKAYGIDPTSGRPDPLPEAIGEFNALALNYQNDAFDNMIKWTASSLGRRFIVDTTFGWHHENFEELPADGSTPGASTGLASQSGVRYRRNDPGLHSIRDFPGERVPDGACVEPNPMAAAACPVLNYSSDSAGFIRQSTLDRYQLRSMLTVVGNALGHHVIKAGVELEMVTYNISKAYAGANLYRENTRGTSFADYRNFGYLVGPDDAVLLAKHTTDTKGYTLGGFVQNSWSVLDKVTVNAGLRYDAQFLYNTFDKLGLALPNQWSPRLGFIFDPTQAGRSRIYGSYARYFQNVPLDMADRALSGEPQIVSSRSKAVCDPTDPVQARTTCRDNANLNVVGTPEDPNQKYGILSGGTVPVDPDIKAPSVDEVVLGVEYEVVQSRLGLAYTRRRLNEIIEDMSRDEANTYFLGNPGRGIARDFPTPVRDYDAFTLSFSRSFQDTWLAQASYTLSWLRGNYSGLFRPESEQLDPNITSDFDLISILPNRDGPLPGDRRHQVKLFGAKDWPLGPHHLLTGIGWRSTSGAPTNYLGSHPVYGPDEVFILERGAGQRLPWNHSLDVRLGYTFSFTQHYNLTAVLDVFNLLNFQADVLRDERYTNSDVLPVAGSKDESRINGAGTFEGGTFNAATEKNPSFGGPLRTQDPLVVQLGVRATF
jgi:outer membrane receptor protein involved in Fe transport